MAIAVCPGLLKEVDKAGKSGHLREKTTMMLLKDIFNLPRVNASSEFAE
jgi:hypothetical protein